MSYRKFPPEYSFKAKHPQHFKRGTLLDQYAYDPIPISVLKTWKQCQELALFEGYEIRTLEFPDTDPVLFRHAQGKVWKIAQWGEAALVNGPLLQEANPIFKKFERYFSVHDGQLLLVIPSLISLLTLLYGNFQKPVLSNAILILLNAVWWMPLIWFITGGIPKWVHTKLANLFIPKFHETPIFQAKFNSFDPSC